MAWHALFPMASSSCCTSLIGFKDKECAEDAQPKNRVHVARRDSFDAESLIMTFECAPPPIRLLRLAQRCPFQVR